MKIENTLGTFKTAAGDLTISSQMHDDGRVLITQTSEAGTFRHVEETARWLARWDNIRDAGLIRA